MTPQMQTGSHAHGTLRDD